MTDRKLISFLHHIPSSQTPELPPSPQAACSPDPGPHSFPLSDSSTNTAAHLRVPVERSEVSDRLGGQLHVDRDGQLRQLRRGQDQ